jgi:hypothetical protein
MEGHNGGHFEQTQNGDAMSPESNKTKLQLPMSCDPPGPGNPQKQLVWIVSYLVTALEGLPATTVVLQDILAEGDLEFSWHPA